MRNIEFIPGQIYHVYNRGVDKREIFQKDNDRWRCLQGLCLFNDEVNSSNILWQLEKTRGSVTLRVLRDMIVVEGRERVPLVRIMTYCLMPNHYHLLVEEIKKGGISKFMQKFGAGYTRYFNNTYERSGSLFQGTFNAVLVKDEIQLEHVLVYINVINPGMLIEPGLKKKGIKDVETVMKFAEEYLWSAHQEYLGKRGSIIISKGILGEVFSDPEKYREFARKTLLGKKFENLDMMKDLMLEE